MEAPQERVLLGFCALDITDLLRSRLDLLLGHRRHAPFPAHRLNAKNLASFLRRYEPGIRGRNDVPSWARNWQYEVRLDPG